MAINKKLIHFEKKENFDNEVANDNILDKSIVFVKNSRELHTHNATYKAVYWKVLSQPQFYIFHEPAGTTYGPYKFEEGMTVTDFMKSEYNTNSSTPIVEMTGGYGIRIGNGVYEVFTADTTLEARTYNTKSTGEPA